METCLPWRHDAGPGCALSTENGRNPKYLRDECKTEPIFVPAGPTSMVQPVDVISNRSLKEVIDAMANSHVQESLENYVRGRITASERILFTKWVGKAWEKISAKDMIIHSYKKCGISLAVDGSEDDQINIEILNDYIVGESDDDDEATDDSDPFEDLDYKCKME